MRKVVFLFLLLLCVVSVPAAQAEEVASAPSLKSMIGQMIMIGFRGEGAITAHVALRDIKKHNVGGVILFEKDFLRPQAVRNIVSKEQV